MRFPTLIACCLLFANLQARAADKIDRRFIELTVAGIKQQGRQLVSDREICWLLKQDGQLQSLNLGFNSTKGSLQH